MNNQNELTNEPTIKTFGEFRVRADFNISNSDVVTTIKQRAAESINFIENERPKSSPDVQTSQEVEKHRLISLAQTSYEEAAMWAVKAATA